METFFRKTHWFISVRPKFRASSVSGPGRRALLLVLGLTAALGLVPHFYAKSDDARIALAAAGLQSLVYGQHEYVADGQFRLNRVEFRTSRGTIAGSTRGACAMNYGQRQLTCQYPWGSIAVSYDAAANRVSLSITTTNRSPNALTALYLEPLTLKLPEKPREYDGSTPLLAANIGEPAVVRLTAAQTTVALVNEGEGPLMTGFPFAADRPGSMKLFPLRVNTGIDPSYPDSLPPVMRVIAPGKTDAYRLSIRFGTPTMNAYDFASDVYKRFAQIHPFRLDWVDRRPIASLILGTTATNWSTNPRGWLLDRSIDVTNEAGIRDFHRRVMEWADNSIAVMRRMNAQGMITWDIEGEEFPQPTTYIGDPRALSSLAPEMNGIADQYFRKFRDAGFKVGICIRPQELTPGPNRLIQNDVANAAKVLKAKIAYARERWGATLFYVDSNGDTNNPISSEIFDEVAAAYPDVLLIPEHHTLAYYGTTAPYRELRLGFATSPAIAKKVYPRAFSVINTADGNIDDQWDQLKHAVSQGDVLMFRGWFDDPSLRKIKALYPSGHE